MLHILKETLTGSERKASTYCWWKEVDPVHTKHPQMFIVIYWKHGCVMYKGSLKYPCDMTNRFPPLLQRASIDYLNSCAHFVEITLSIVLTRQLAFRSIWGQNVQAAFKIECLFCFAFFAALRLQDEISTLLIASIFLSKVMLRNTPVISHLMETCDFQVLCGDFFCFPMSDKQ